MTALHKIMLSGQPWRIEPFILKAGNTLVCKLPHNILSLQSEGSRYSDRLWARRPRFDSRQGEDFSLLHSVRIGIEVNSASYPMSTGGSFIGSKEAGA
jgi:hypothetical protein